MIIRPFRASDVEDLIRLAQESFAEEFTARGATPESFAQQMRMAARGRMVPFRLATALAGYKWEMFVAEIDGTLVGFGGYLGRKRMELVNLMVAPAYRRRGIGQALLKKRLERLKERGFPFATTTILASNQASLGNVLKQGFEVYDRYVVLEKALPIASINGITGNTIIARDIQPADLVAFEQIETQISTPLLLELQGSAGSNYLSSFGERLMDKLTGTQQQVWVFTRDEEIIGFFQASTSSHQTKGVISRPIVAKANLQYLPEMFQEVSRWLVQLDKVQAQVFVPEARKSLLSNLLEQDWTIIQHWVRLVKHLP